ncbi:hypothetical protein [Fuchsiella alkaliacetigena]|uniref:ribonuclease toxin HepT-like protein n=1 Tax=Fuchsiella alkaliacetigena TaxID=957042 RepID=UPI00200A1F77|nr:hypothetical protein [Fuchsiella alkaliacetigena]MCK8824315.1 hypothetical protein [Fuchsiella alkaliacetigena]
MNKRYLTLISRIEDELSDLEEVVERVEKAWQRVEKSNDDLYLDSVALNLHGFYAGLERVFELIATEIDESKPEGASWHRDLLRQMGVEIKQVRRAILSKETINELDEYRGFRHIVRNVYTFNLSKKRLEPLVVELSAVFEQVEDELEEFIKFMEAEGS